jgi:hypothetical protein
MRILLAAVVNVTALAGASADDKRPAKVERITYRVIGLFHQDREAALKSAVEELRDFKLIGIDFKEAEITLEFAPARLWPGEKPERIPELVNERIRAATGHTFGVKPRRAITRDKLIELSIPAAGCDCKACCLAAYEAVAQIEGVYRATASFKDGVVTALIDPTKTDRTALEDALRKKGVDLGKPPKK